MIDEVRFRLLDEPLISVSDAAGQRGEPLSLPALYAALAEDTVGDFPALRPHQRHVWHAFLVQVATLALLRAGRSDMPVDTGEWRELLLRLTPDDADGAAWALVAPHDRPALLQAPVPGGQVSGFERVLVPDDLDVLVASRNHDIKRSIMMQARSEHWLFALLSLQTQQGYSGGSGRLNGISRMNGGGGSRAGIGIQPDGGPGRRVTRDVRALLEERAAILEDYRDCYPATGGIGLVWLEPWDGATSLPLEKLDPYYVEICRRVRLGVRDGDTLYALTKPSERSVSRVDSDQMPGGRTGDPWVPLAVEKGIRVAYTAPKRPFRYDRLVSLIFPLSTDAHAATPARLQVPRQADDAGALRIVARVLVRDRMKTGTFGYHERHVAVTKSMRRMLGLNQVSDYAAHVAAERVKDASEIARRVLYPALLAVYTAAPSATERQRDDDTAKDRVRRALDRFDDAVDATFFADLDEELRHDGDATAQQAVRSRWLASLRERGHAVLESALASAPRAAMRHYRTQVRARARFGAAFARHFGERLAPPPTDDPTGDPA